MYVTTEGQYSPVRLELANKKYRAYDRFHGNGPYGEIPTKKEPIRTLGFTLPYNKGRYFYFLVTKGNLTLLFFTSK